MYADARLSAATDSMMRGIAVPPAPTAAIRARMTAPPAVPSPRRFPLWRYAIAAAAAIALVFAIFPRTSLAVIERFERIVVASYAAADSVARRVTNWTPPPPPPKSLDAAQRSQQVSLVAAQAEVNFRIVPPAGLPGDAVFSRIDTMPSLVYDYKKHRWSKGVPALSFEYRRSGNRTFSLMVENDDPHVDIPGNHVWSVDELPNGKVLMEKHEHFAWKNGGQMMSATEDTGITAAEIEAIRDAMHGKPVIHYAKPSLVKRYRLP